MSIGNHARYSGAVGDTRRCGKVEQSVLDLLVIAVRLIAACIGNSDRIALHGRSKLAGLRIILSLGSGTGIVRELSVGFNRRYGCATPRSSR